MANFDEKTGIRYGVISPHSISSFALEDIYQNGTDPQYEDGKASLLLDLTNFLKDYGIDIDRINTDSIIDEFNNHYESDGSGIMDYSDREYDLHVSGDNFGIFVMRSPYYTYCSECSPCAPGAGDLDSPIEIDPVNDMDDSDRALCLGPEWFDKDQDQYSSKIPYRVFRVDNDQEVVES